jgi:hypothetical protein
MKYEPVFSALYKLADNQMILYRNIHYHCIPFQIPIISTAFYV